MSTDERIALFFFLFRKEVSSETHGDEIYGECLQDSSEYERFTYMYISSKVQEIFQKNWSQRRAGKAGGVCDDRRLTVWSQLDMKEESSWMIITKELGIYKK